MKIAGHEVTVIDNNTVKVGCKTFTRGEVEKAREALEKGPQEQGIKVTEMPMMTLGVVLAPAGDAGNFIVRTYAKGFTGGVVAFVDGSNCGGVWSDDVSWCDRNGYRVRLLTPDEMPKVRDVPIASKVKIGGTELIVEQKESGMVEGLPVFTPDADALLKAMDSHKPAPKLKVGDFVKVVDGSKWQGRHGKVVMVPGDPCYGGVSGYFGVEFAQPDPNSFINLDGRTRIGHGMWFAANQLEKVD